uniref:AF-6 n=1 Tax=Scophthalmus maximus TaxID=52904 RepID=A0A8K1PTD4_SCOMX|nr:AF-6 [Scophthalmus maximus]
MGFFVFSLLRLLLLLSLPVRREVVVLVFDGPWSAGLHKNYLNRLPQNLVEGWDTSPEREHDILGRIQDLEFHGVMRFYFQDRVAGNFATKCIRVSSTATTQDVIETLAEKFRPDMRMLSSPKYSLYEVHVSGEERQLDLDEKPLVVQLNWNKDDREGRFVLKNENDILPKKSQSNGPEKEKDGVIQNFKRTLSKKEKKKEKKREKEFARIPDGDEQVLGREDGENSRLAAEVYKDMPETSFTRTISNPEVVMKRRRQQKLEKRMQEFMSSDGRPDSGGTLRIYADSLKPNIPYKTILLSTRDTADFAVVEALEKYGLEKENPREYCIARQDDKSSKEAILDDSECPLQIFRDWPADRGALVFQLKKRPPDYQGRKGRKADDKGLRGKDGSGSLPPEKLPYLVELSPGRGNHYAYYAYRHHEDGSDSRDKPKLYRLQHSITEVGSDCTEDGAIQLLGPGILPHHCNLMHSEGMVTVTPHGADADTFVDGQRVTETTVLRPGSTLQFGSAHVFKFVDPMFDQGAKREPAAMTRSRHKSGSVPETTFDLHGDVHSGAALPTSKSSGKLDMERGMVKPMIRGEQQDGRSQDVSADRTELTLPAGIEFRDNSEDTFLSAIINYTNSSTVHFKLSPTYVLYMACRFVLSPSYRPDMSPSERTHKVIAIVNKMVSMMEGVIQEIPEGDQKQKNIAGALAFWMANASELLNFVKQDRDLSRVTLDAQDILAHLVQMAFKSVWECFCRLTPHPRAPGNWTVHFEGADCDSHFSGVDASEMELIDHVVAVAENTADELARSDGREVQLEEDPDLQLPFLLPEDGYSCDVVRSLPNGLQDFLDPLLQRDGINAPEVPPNSLKCLRSLFFGAWTPHLALDEWLHGAGQEKLGIYIKSVVKGGAADVGAGQEKLGIYIKSVVKGGAADVDGRLAAGDQLLSVDGRSLVGLSQERAAELMTRTGSVVTLEVAKQGAIYHGLATLLNQPSPMMQRASDRGREKNGKLRPKSEGFELYNSSSVQNGSPESPQAGWDSYPEPKKMSGEERLLKNRADHRSSPNVANQSQSPAGKAVYPGGPGTKITSVSTGNLCADEEPSPPRPEAYPIPTQTYPRDYFTIPASKSQDRVVGPGQGPSQHWQGMEDRERLPMVENIHNSMQRVNHSQEELYPPPGVLRPDERMQPHYQQDYQHRDLDYQHRDMDYQRGPPGGVGGPDHWAPQPQVSSSLESSTSSQEHLNFSASSSSSNKAGNQKTGPGRWKTPNAPHSAPPPHASQPPSRSDLPPPPPPPPAAYPEAYDPYDPQPDLPLPPPPAAVSPAAAQQAADRKKREEQQRWYEKEKARLEEERERKRREQERKLGQIRANPVMPVQPHNNGGSMPPPHHQPPLASVAPPQPYLPPQPQPQPPPSRPEKLASLPRSAVPPPASASNPPGMDTVIRDLLPQQQPRTIERRDLQYITISKEELTSDSLSPDPWKRDAREKAEKQQQLHIVDLLDKEIQDLQAKPERTAEESDRLRKLMLEWQFQKRLQESKQSDEDEEEEDDEDVDTILIMQRLEAEKRARQQTAVPAISVLDLLQDEERRRKQQLEEIRKREAEERAKQEEERRWREEERAKREAEEKRRQEQEYYTRLEAERRRQHDEAERKLLTPDDPAGLYRPPLPRDYQPPAQPLNPTNTPPPPPQRNTSYLKTQRNTSYLKTQVASPDTLYTAKFVSYAGDEEDEEEGKEYPRAGSGGGGGHKLSATRKSYGDLPAASASPNHGRPQPPPTARKPRPLSDGIFLSASFQPPVNNSNSTGPPLPAKPSSVPPGGFKALLTITLRLYCYNSHRALRQVQAADKPGRVSTL